MVFRLIGEEVSKDCVISCFVLGGESFSYLSNYFSKASIYRSSSLKEGRRGGGPILSLLGSNCYFYDFFIYFLDALWEGTTVVSLLALFLRHPPEKLLAKIYSGVKWIS